MAIDFHEILFPLPLSYQARSKVDYRTSVIKDRSGNEERLLEWFDPLREYDISPVMKDQADLDTLVEFFRARQGPKFGFRFRDPLDSSITQEILATSPGTIYQFQLVKRYTSGIAGDTHTAVRQIEKPVTGTVRVFDDFIERFHFVVDTTTGIVSFHLPSELVDLERVASDDRIASQSGTNFQTFGVIVGDLVTVVGSALLDGTYTVSAFQDGGLTMVVSGADFSVAEAGVTVALRFPAGTSGTPVVVRATSTYDVPVRFVNESLPTRIHIFEDFETPALLQEIRGNVPSALADDALDETRPPEFVEAQFPDNLAEGSAIGPQEDVVVFSADSGYEARTSRLDFGMLVATVPHTLQDLTQTTTLLNFFHARKGRYTGFRFKDITDFEVALATTIGLGDDVQHAFDFVKIYTDSSGTQTRRIKKPVAGTVVVFRDAVPVVVNLVVDTVQGQAVFTLGLVNITFDQAAGTLTRDVGDWLADGIVIGTRVKIEGSASNDSVFGVAIVTALVLTVDEAVVDEAEVSVSVHLPPVSGELITWTGEFDVPVRFDTDQIDLSLDGFEVQSWNNIQLIETSEDPTGGSYIAGVSGLTTSPLTVCGAKGQALGVPSQFTLRFVNDFLGWSPLGAGGGNTEDLHRSWAGKTGFTVAFAFAQNSINGTILSMPHPGVTEPVEQPLNHQLQIQHLANKVKVETADGSVMRAEIAGICASGAEFQSEMISELGYNPVADRNRFNALSEITCYVMTVLPSQQVSYFSGSIHGILPHFNPLRDVTDQGFLTHFCVNLGGEIFPTFTQSSTYGGEPSGSVGESGAAWFWEAGIGGESGFIGTSNLINTITMDLYEFCLFPTFPGFDSVFFIHLMHAEFLKYFYNKYALGLNPPTLPFMGIIGWWDAGRGVRNIQGEDISWNNGKGGIEAEIASWDSIVGGASPQLSESRGGLALPVYKDVGTAPKLPIDVPFLTFLGISPIEVRSELDT